AQSKHDIPITMPSVRYKSPFVSFHLLSPLLCFSFFFFNDTPTTEIYTLSLHDALPILQRTYRKGGITIMGSSVILPKQLPVMPRSEEHTSELQSRRDLVCRLLLEKKKMHEAQRDH